MPDAKVPVIIHFTDTNGEEICITYDAFRLVDDYFITLYEEPDEFAAIETLKPSAKYPDYFEPDKTIMTFKREFDALNFVRNIGRMTAADLIRLIAEVCEE
ncbi:hypothetical protein [Caldibacillus debilis]|uniref:Uncharacterized protein n=1 Tax=Caldibacillus debilis TaxID=301148 RepID=A0A150L6T1_9BACI|nr:hypothetical protein [Caldibacillus debilis]KYD08033.1 hypothetical protein B4135_4190 [Caldibacillus debilis]